VSKKTTIPSSVGAFVFFLPLFQKSFPSLLSIHFSLVQLSKGSPAFVPSSVSFSVYFFLCFPFPPASCLYRLPLCLSLPSSICLVLLCFLPPPFSFVQTLPPFTVSKEPSLIPPKSPPLNTAAKSSIYRRRGSGEGIIAHGEQGTRRLVGWWARGFKFWEQHAIIVSCLKGRGALSFGSSRLEEEQCQNDTV